MIISVEEARKYITTNPKDSVLAAKLQALEESIRNYTNNRFHAKPKVAIDAFVRGGVFLSDSLIPFAVGDTVQVTYGRDAEDYGLYTVKEITDDTTFTVNEDIADMDDIHVIKVVYPMNVKMGAINILKWQLKNEAAADGDKESMPIQSETISRHSVTYAQDASEADLDVTFGVPKKHLAFLNQYRKARF